MLSFDFAKRYTKSHLAECCYAECRDAKIKVTKNLTRKFYSKYLKHVVYFHWYIIPTHY